MLLRVGPLRDLRESRAFLALHQIENLLSLAFRISAALMSNTA